MGNLMTIERQREPNRVYSNRMPIYTPRHVPKDMDYPPNYEKFDPENYKEKFEYPKREEPKYW